MVGEKLQWNDVQNRTEAIGRVRQGNDFIGQSFEPIGARPAPPKPDPAAAEDAPPPIPAITVNFSADSRTVIFSTFPAKADVDKARNAKPKPAEAPPAEAAAPKVE